MQTGDGETLQPRESAPKRYRFSVLLGLLMLLLVSAPVTPYVLRHLSHGSQHMVSALVVTGFLCLVVLWATVAVDPSPRISRLAKRLAVATILLQALNISLEWAALSIAAHVIAAAFIGLVITVLIGHLFEHRRITGELICASLCAYVLLGILWAIAYSLLELILPGSFSITNAAGPETSAMLFGAEHSSLPLYYSFITLTTLGYGDVLPASAFAQMLASMEALFGQMYLAVLVARMVGLHISQSMSETGKTDS